MPTLRTMVKIWIGFLVGVASSITAISLVPPMSSFTHNLIVGASAFVLGAGGMTVLDRMVADDATRNESRESVAV